MIFDFTYTMVMEGVIIFPDWAFSSPPRQDPIIEQEIIHGGSSTTVSITGRVDN